MKEVILYRDYLDNEFVRDFMIFKPEEDNTWTLYIVRTEFGVVANAATTKIADSATAFKGVTVLLKDGFEYLSDEEIEQIDKDKFYM